MGGPSSKKEKDHKEVIDLFFKKQKEVREKYGAYSKEVRYGTLYNEVADETGYAFTTVRIIMNTHFKTKTKTHSL